MKKLSFIVLVALIAAVTSCQKEVVSPANNTTMDQPTWESGITTNSDKGSSVVRDKSGDGGDGLFDLIGGTSSESEDSGITDPNKDPDASKRKGSKGKK